MILNGALCFTWRNLFALKHFYKASILSDFLGVIIFTCKITFSSAFEVWQEQNEWIQISSTQAILQLNSRKFSNATTLHTRWNDIGDSNLVYFGDLLVTLCCCFLFGRVVVSLTHSPFPFSMLLFRFWCFNKGSLCDLKGFHCREIWALLSWVYFVIHPFNPVTPACKITESIYEFRTAVYYCWFYWVRLSKECQRYSCRLFWYSSLN